MKKIIILFFCFSSFLLLGCNRNSVLPRLDQYKKGSLVSMPFRIEASMSTTGSVRGLGLGLGSTSGDGITPQILFKNWDNGENKPKVLLIVHSDGGIDWANVLDPSEYEYTTSEDGKGIIRMTTTIKYLDNPRLKEYFYMYVFDNDVTYSLRRTTYSGGADRYYVRINFPTLDKGSDGYYSLDPLVKQKYKLIFKMVDDNWTIENLKAHLTSKQDIISPLRTIRLRPLGSLFAFRLKNISKEDYPIISNSFMIRFKLSGIKLGGGYYDCGLNMPKNLDIPDYAKIDHTKIDKIDESYYPPSGYDKDHFVRSTYIKLNVHNPTVLKPGSFSVPYAIYVLPQPSPDPFPSDLIRVTHPHFNTYGDLVKEDYLFKPDKTFNFYSEYMDKSVSFTLDVPYGDGGISNLVDFGDAGTFDGVLDPNHNIQDFTGDVTVDNHSNTEGYADGNIHGFGDTGSNLPNNIK